jgi:outer membrane receptor protein involved in Fe transport
MKGLSEKHHGRWRGRGIFIAAAAVICFWLSGFITAPACRADNREPADHEPAARDQVAHDQPDFDQAQDQPQDQAQDQPVDFTSLSLEELKQVMIISILKKPQKLSEATSAISVITQDDIRRSGATTIPDLLRDLPGLQVAQINANTWAVSARGFNHRFANKLLILMDGRCLYTPLFSGVYWNVQDTVLEDIERIEVIRGPGATLW